MKQIQIGALVCAVLALGACASFSGRVGRDPQPPGIDQAVVAQLVCEARQPDARTYIVERGGQDADVTERVERAKVAIAVGQAQSDPKFAKCCAGDRCPAAKQ